MGEIQMTLLSGADEMFSKFLMPKHIEIYTEKLIGLANPLPSTIEDQSDNISLI